MSKRYSSFMMDLLPLSRARFLNNLRSVPRSDAFAALAAAIFITLAMAGVTRSIPGKATQVASVAAQAGVAGIPNTGTNSAPPVVVKDDGPMREVHVANNGAVFLRGAKITALHGSSIEVTAGWGSMDFNWIVHTPISTHYISAKGNAINNGALKVGTIVAITGVLDQSADVASMRAQYIRISAVKK